MSPEAILTADEGSTAVRDIADLAPKLAALTDEVVFGDIWERPGLSKRDRSLITVSALVALYRTEQLPIHLRLALDNGVTQERDRRGDHAPRVLRRLAERVHGHQSSRNRSSRKRTANGRVAASILYSSTSTLVARTGRARSRQPAARVGPPN